MLADRFGGQHSSDDPAAVVLFEEAVLGVLAHRPYVAQALERVLATDASFTAAHALKGLAAIVLARGELLAPAAAALHSARLGLAARGGTAGEHYLVDTLAQAMEGRLEQAVIRLDARLACAPEDLLAIKVAHSFRFMLGDTAGMLGTSNAILPAWSASQAGYGFVLGCHAFALEERGFYAQAERTGRRAVALSPRDAWGRHAVAHVLGQVAGDRMAEQAAEIVGVGRCRRDDRAAQAPARLQRPLQRDLAGGVGVDRGDHHLVARNRRQLADDLDAGDADELGDPRLRQPLDMVEPGDLGPEIGRRERAAGLLLLPVSCWQSKLLLCAGRGMF